MAEGDEVRTRAGWSPLTGDENPNKTREEGEISSSDHDENPTDYAVPFSAAASDREEFDQDASLFKNLKDTNVGRCLYTNHSMSLDKLPATTSALSNCQRSTQKNRLPFVPFVIRFSDDDSGSESEELMQSKPSENKASTVCVKQKKKPLAPSVLKVQTLGQTTRHVASAMPNRSSLSRTLTSSMANINRQTSNHGGHSMVDKRSRFKNLSPSDRKLVAQEHGGYHISNLDSSKLQDLRLQIAMREKELKLKSAKQNKDNKSDSCRYYNVSDSEIDAPSKRRTVSADFAESKVREKDRKRVKLSEPHQIQQVSDVHHHVPPPELGMPLGMCALDNTDKKGSSNHRPLEGGLSRISGRSECAQLEKQVGTSGVDISIDRNSCDMDKLLYPSNSSEQTERVVTTTAKSLSRKPNTTGLKHSESHCNGIANRAICGHDLADSAKLHDARFGEKALDPTVNTRHQGCSISARKRPLETSNAFLNDARLPNYWHTTGISQDNYMNMTSLLDIEEMQEKELEEAQEHRYKCEVEERNALKAYRKAQRALIEANARCSHLYQKREFCSAHMQSLMIQNPSFLQSSTLHNQINSLECLPDVDDLPTSSHQMLDTFGVHHEKDHLLNINAVDSAIHSAQERHAARLHVVTDPFSEPDDSTSALHKEKMARELHSPSTGLSSSADEDGETCSFDDKSADSHLGCTEKENYTNAELNRRSSLDTSQNSLVLEATLRSQLFARLGTKALSQNSGPAHNFEPSFDPREEHNGDKEQAETNKGNVKEKCQNSASGGFNGVENLSSKFPVQNNDSKVENFSSHRTSPTADLKSYFSLDGKQTPRAFTYPCPILRSTFSCLRMAKQDSTVGLKNRNQDFHTCDTCNDEEYSFGRPQTQLNNLRLNSTDETAGKRSPTNLCFEKVGYYTSNVTIDPFRPLCVFELRGKCNDDECLWQHIKDNSSRNINLKNSENPDSQHEFSNCGGKLCTVKQSSSGLDYHGLAPPAYLVSLDMIRADLHPRGSLVTNVQQYWQKCLSNSLVLSCKLTSDLPTDEPILHGSDAHVEFHGRRNIKSLYFHRSLSTNQLEQQITDNDQILEVALLNLSQDVDKRNGKVEALKVLARSIEANPLRVILWVAYLHIYHSADHFVGKDDMFYLAVEVNQGSYELWLMYINTRMQLEDRVIAFNKGILALCRHGSTADGNAPHTSACILDLFLQYLDNFGSSGNSSRAAEEIFEIFLSEKNSESPDMLSSILPCLTLSDKCILWFCCIYFTVYKKLPDAIVQGFECQKVLNELEWAFAYLTSEEKHRAGLLMEMAVDSLALVFDNGTLESESAFDAAHMFAINHVKCIAVLEGLECSKKLLDNYTKIYPSCLELVLMSAQTKASDGDLKFAGFEDALKNWEEEVPGVHCIWNEYVNFVLQKGKLDFAKQLMDRWFHSIWQVRYSQYASAFDCETSSLNSSNIDVMFGLINLSLHKLFNNDLVEARLAIDRALKSASAENYKRCVKEHVSFFLSSKNSIDREFLEILKSYVVDQRATSTVQPLSRKFIDGIKKPRVRNLVSNIWSDLSPDFSLVNMVLEEFFGPSLLPPLSCKLEGLVDIVEALMEISPANYGLAISVGKRLSRDVKLTDVASAGVSFWAASLITNSLFQTVPIPPELNWIEAADTLRNLTDTRFIIENFHERALTAYPSSIQLWKSYLNFFQVIGNTSSIIAAAKERGIILD